MVREKNLPAGWRKGQCPCKIKRRFLGDGKFRRKPALPNIILTLLNMSWRRKKRFLVDGMVRGRPTAQNVIVAVLKAL